MVLVGGGSLISGAVRQIIGSSNLRWPRTKAWMRVCASLNESIDSVLAFKKKKTRKEKQETPFCPLLISGLSKQRTWKRDPLMKGIQRGCCCALQSLPPERRAYHEEHARTTKFIYAHMQSVDITEESESAENCWGGWWCPHPIITMVKHVNQLRSSLLWCPLYWVNIQLSETSILFLTC